MTFGIESGKAQRSSKSDASLEDGDKAILLSHSKKIGNSIYHHPAAQINPGQLITLNLGISCSCHQFYNSSKYL